MYAPTKLLRSRMPWRTLTSTVAFACLALSACHDATVTTQATPKNTFHSIKPGSTNSGSASNSAGTGAAASGTDAQQVIIVKGDVARLDGSTLYVVNQWRGLQVVDVANPAQPKLIARAAMNGQPQEMYVENGEGIVLLTQVASLDDAGGKPIASAGSQVKRMQLGNSPKELGSFSLPGTIYASKKIGNNLVLIVPQVNWNPWYFGCYGPYACAASANGGGVATAGTGASSSGTSSAIAYPGGYNGGIQADKTRIVVLNLSPSAGIKEVGEVEIPGGVLGSSIQIGEVLVASQNWNWSGDSGTIVTNYNQIKIAGDGTPTLGGKLQQSAPWTADGALTLAQVEYVGPGKLMTVAMQYQTDGYAVNLAQMGVAGDTWKQTSVLAQPKTSYAGKLAVDGAVALYASAPPPNSVPVDGSGKDPAGDATGTYGIDIIDISSDSTMTVQGHLALSGDAYGLWYDQFQSVGNGHWVIATRGASYTDVVLRSLDVTDAKKPTWSSQVQVSSNYGAQAELINPTLMAIATTNPDPSKTQFDSGIELISLASDGKLQARGTFQSNYLYYYQLHSLLANDKLIRVSNQALEIIDVANLDAPKPLGKLELAAMVMDLTAAGGRPVALVQSWSDGKTFLRVLPVGGTDELNPDGQLEVQSYGQLYANGSFVYAVDYQSVRVFDVSDPKSPKARGQWSATVDPSVATDQYYWNTWQVAQKDSTLYFVGTKVTYTTSTGVACTGSSTGGSSGPDSAPSADATAAPDPADAGSTEPSDGADASATDGGKEPTDAGGAGDSGVNCYANPVYTTRIAALDLSDPDNPKVSTTIELADVSWASDLKISGNTLVLTHYKSLQGTDGQWWGEYWLDRIDISKPAAPKLTDSINIPGSLVGLSADGKSAVTMDWQLQDGTKEADGKYVIILHGISLSDGQAEVKSTLNLQLQASTTLRQGDEIYVSAWPYWWQWPQATGSADPGVQTSLLVIDAKDPAKLTQTLALDTGAGITGMQVQGSLLFANLANTMGIGVWNLTDPATPVFQQFLPTNGYWWAPRVTVVGGSAYVPAGWYGISAWTLGK